MLQVKWCQNSNEYIHNRNRQIHYIYLCNQTNYYLVKVNYTSLNKINRYESLQTISLRVKSCQYKKSVTLALTAVDESEKRGHCLWYNSFNNCLARNVYLAIKFNKILFSIVKDITSTETSPLLHRLCSSQFSKSSRSALQWIHCSMKPTMKCMAAMHFTFYGRPI